MRQKSRFNVKELTMISMMTAILCILAPLSVPVGDVPISVATLVVYIAAVLLGTKRSVLCVGLYILIGIVGVPVFSGWKNGIAVIAGPTGGYLLGYLLIALCTGLLCKVGQNKILMIVLGMILGTLCCYVLGTVWLAWQLSLTAKAALWAGVIPFLPGDIAKIAITIMIAVPTRKHLWQFINTEQI